MPRGSHACMEPCTLPRGADTVFLFTRCRSAQADLAVHIRCLYRVHSSVLRSIFALYTTIYRTFLILHCRCKLFDLATPLPL